MPKYARSGNRGLAYTDPFGLCPNPTALGLGSLQCALQDIAAGGKAWLTGRAQSIKNHLSYFHAGVTGTMGNNTFGVQISGYGRIHPTASINANAPNVGGSADVGYGKPGPRARATGSTYFGWGRHASVSIDLEVDSGSFQPKPYGATVHFGTPAIIPSSPVGASGDLPLK